MVKSMLVEGTVLHARLKPFIHRFSYKVFYLKIPLSKIADLKNGIFSQDSFNLFSLNTKDYLDGSEVPLKEKIHTLLVNEGVEVDALGEIVLQTFPRILGYVFNPVSFWLVHDRHGNLKTVLAEVNNTFGDRHCYLLDNIDGSSTCRLLKEFHVSPFFDIKGEYHFRFHQRRSEVNYFDSEENKYFFTSSLNEIKMHDFSVMNLLKLFFKFPAMNLLIMARIHWQAFRLYLKKAQFYTRPQPPLNGLTKGQL